MRPLVRGRSPVKGFDHLPVDEELTPPGIGQSLMIIRGTPLAIGKPFGVRPGVPADRVAMLRDAFAKVVRDPQFLADAEKIADRHRPADGGAGDQGLRRHDEPAAGSH